MIAAGGHHTVALKSKDIVVGAGANIVGQCDVGD
jgi:alpha-tubulin suppressor-like RCC1 family protein